MKIWPEILMAVLFFCALILLGSCVTAPDLDFEKGLSILESSTCSYFYEQTNAPWVCHFKVGDAECIVVGSYNTVVDMECRWE